jgi:hypothetical protein
MKKWSQIFLVVSTLVAGMAMAAPAEYVVTVDTSAVNGTSGFLHLQFNGGRPPYLPAKVQIVNFQTTGGAPGALNSTSGDVTGALPNSVALGNSAPLNELFQAVTFGTKLSFTVILSGPAVDSPNRASASGSTFGVSLYDSSEKPILTIDPSGVAGQIHINANGTTTPMALPVRVKGGPSIVTVAPATAPRDPVDGTAPKGQNPVR